MAACLEGFRGSGVLESTGDFTLSDERAQAKFREFSLEKPHLYVLNLQAAALSGGASWVDFQADADDLYFSSNPDFGPAGDLENVNSLALSDSSSLAIRELALALNASLSLEPRLLSLQYWDGKCGTTITWEDERFHYTPLAAPPVSLEKDNQPTLRFHLREKLGRRTLGKFISRIGGAVAVDSEQDAIARHCNRAPVPVRFNGQDVRRPLAVQGADRALLIVDGPLPEHHPLNGLFELERLSAPGSYRGVIARGGRLPPWLTLVVNGVNFRLSESAFGSGGLRGVIYTESLRKDLSQSQLVQDGPYRKLIEDLTLLGGRHLGRS